MSDKQEGKKEEATLPEKLFDEWDRVSMAVSSTLFPPWYTKGWSNRHLQGALWILGASIPVSAAARVLAASRPWEMDLSSLKSVVTAAIPAAIAFLVGLFSLRQPERQWRKYFVYTVVSWMMILVACMSFLVLASIDLSIFRFLDNFLPNFLLNMFSSQVILLFFISTLCIGLLYARCRYQGLLLRDPFFVVLIAYFISAALFSSAGWLAIYSDFGL